MHWIIKIDIVGSLFAEQVQRRDFLDRSQHSPWFGFLDFCPLLHREILEISKARLWSGLCKMIGADSKACFALNDYMLSNRLKSSGDD